MKGRGRIDNSEKIKSLLRRMAGDLRKMSRWPGAIRREDIEGLQSQTGLLLYLTTPAQGVDLRRRRPKDLGQLECSVCHRRLYETVDGKPRLATALWQISRAGQPQDWRCVEHIPPDIVFPVGLWGEDWARSGRDLAVGKRAGR